MSLMIPRPTIRQPCLPGPLYAPLISPPGETVRAGRPTERVALVHFVSLRRALGRLRGSERFGSVPAGARFALHAAPATSACRSPFYSVADSPGPVPHRLAAGVPGRQPAAVIARRCRAVLALAGLSGAFAYTVPTRAAITCPAKPCKLLILLEPASGLEPLTC